MPKVSKHQYKATEMYRFYKKNTKDPVDNKTYVKVRNLWGDIVRRYLLEGKDVQLHSGLALIGIRKREQSKYFSFPALGELKRPIFKTNVHSDGYLAYVYWNSHKVNYKRTGWKFKAGRRLKRELASVMFTPKGHTKYLKRAEAHGVRSRDNYKAKMLKI